MRDICLDARAGRRCRGLRSRRGGRGIQGFTLVEVLVVITIIAIAGAIIVPQMLQAGSLTVQATGRMVIADVLYAQNEAIAHQATRQVIFDAVNNRYWLADDQGNKLAVSWKAGVGGNYEVDLSADSRFQGVTLANVNFGGGSTLAFDALGSPATGGSVDVVAKNFHYRITVAAMTGRVTIAPVPGG